MQREKVIKIKENSKPGILSALLAAVISSFLCIGFAFMVGTTFKLEIDALPVILCAILTSVAFALLNYLNRNYVSLATIIICIVLSVILAWGDYLELQSGISSVLYHVQLYSCYWLPGKYLNTYTGSHAIDTLLLIYNFTAASVVTFAVTRRKNIVPSLLVFLPHFMISVSNVSMCPAQAPCIVAATGLFLALLAHAYRHKKRDTADKTLLVLTVPVLLFALMWGAFFPAKHYEKYEVAKKFLLILRDKAEESSSFDNTKIVRFIDWIYHGKQNPDATSMTDGTFESTYKAICPSTTDLMTVGPFNPPLSRVLTVYKSLNSYYSGPLKQYEGGFLYLKVESLDTYKDNVLSASDIYMHVFNEDYKPGENNAQFAIALTPAVGSSVDIQPYYTDYYRARTDIYTVANPYNTSSSGTYYYLASSVPVKTGNIYSSIYLNDYVYGTALKVPEETEEAILNSGILPAWYLNVYYGESTMSDADKVRRVTEFVSNLHPYDKNTELPPEGVDFVPWFMTESESGICVHYAATSMILLRMIGIPARYVRGYNDAGAYPQKESTIYANEAHAWFEFFIPEYGWIMGDATPGAAFGASYFDINGVAEAYPEIETAEFSRHVPPPRPVEETEPTETTPEATTDTNVTEPDGTTAPEPADETFNTPVPSAETSSDEPGSTTSPSSQNGQSEPSSTGTVSGITMTDASGETPETNDEGEIIEPKKSIDLSALYPVFLAALAVIRTLLIVVIAVLVLALVFRAAFYTYWIIQFSAEDINGKAIAYYHYFSFLSAFSKTKLPRTATAIAEKAAFGQGKITTAELKTLLKTCKKNSSLISQKLPRYLGIIYKLMEINIRVGK